MNKNVQNKKKIFNFTGPTIVETAKIFIETVNTKGQET